MSDVQEQAVREQCKALRMPAIGGQFARLAEAAVREGQSHVGYLEALLAAEMEERESRALARLSHGAGQLTAPAAAVEDARCVRIRPLGRGRRAAAQPGRGRLRDPRRADPADR